MKNCTNCGSALQEKSGTFRFEPPPNIPGGTMVVQNATWLECENCGEQVLPAALDRTLQELSIKRQGLLLPAEIKAIREKSGLSQATMAERLGAGEKTYTRWESGRSIQNKSSDNLIRVMDKAPQTLAVIEAQRNPERAKIITGYFDHLWQIGGRSQTAMAAHDAELTAETAEKVREALRTAVKQQTQK